MITTPPETRRSASASLFIAVLLAAPQPPEGPSPCPLATGTPAPPSPQRGTLEGLRRRALLVAATSGEDTRATPGAILRDRESDATRRRGMSDGLYLGKQVDPATGALGTKLELDPADLLTHGLIVGMTGSGKTGLAIVLVEEALRQGVPVIAIDPKGDLADLLLLFDALDPASFAPWVAPEAARRDGLTPAAAGEQAAAAWKKGLADWGLGEPDIAAL